MRLQKLPVGAAMWGVWCGGGGVLKEHRSSLIGKENKGMTNSGSF